MRKRAAILLRTSLLSTFAVSLFGPYYALFIKDIGGDILDTGVAYALFAITNGVFILLFGRSKFFSKHLRTMVIAGYCLLTVAEMGYLFVQNPMQLFIVQFLIGIGNGILEPSWDGLYSAKLQEKSASRQWASWSGSQYIIVGLAALIGGAILATQSFLVLFAVMAVFNLLSLLSVISLLHQRAPAA